MVSELSVDYTFRNLDIDIDLDISLDIDIDIDRRWHSEANIHYLLRALS